MQLQNLERMFSKLPITDNISAIKKLRHFIQDYPDEQLWPNLYRLEQNYKYYRAIKGDGNCFYRAIMFLYLREANLGHYQQLFPAAQLFNCKRLPFQMSNNYSSEHVLEYVWQKYLLPLSNFSRAEREKQLQKIMNSSLVLDAILVAYFRILNYDYLLQHRTEYQPFCDGIQNDLQRILTYGKQSQGVQILTLAKILSAKIEVMIVHRQTLQPVSYNKEGQGKRCYTLFYRPGHYDILSDNEQIDLAFSTAPTFTQFYRENAIQNKVQPFFTVNRSNLSSNSAKSSDSNIISISKPEQIKYIPIDISSNQIEKKPFNNAAQFKEEIMKNNKNEKKEKFNKKQSAIEDSSKKQPVQIKAFNIQKKPQIKKQRMMLEALCCVGVAVFILVGIFAI